MRRILVLRGGALGDLIVTLPALAALRRRWPASRIELVGNATAAELGRAAGLLDVVHSQHEARWSALYGDAALPADFGAWLAGFDLVANFWPDPERELARRFPLRSGQVFVWGDAMPTRAPAAAHYGEALRALGIEVRDYFYPFEIGRIAPNPPRQDAPRRIRRVGDNAPYLALHAGSGSPRKNWPLENWIELCRWLERERRVELLVVSGEAETSDALATFGRTAKNLPLLQLAAELAPCRLFLGHDSGVSHLAAACGVPGVLLFGPTDPAMWAPPTSHVRVIKRGETLAAISLSEVQNAISALLADRM